jgi:hypothetical protein
MLLFFKMKKARPEGAMQTVCVKACGIQSVPGGKAILSRKLYMYMCPIQNGFRDRTISVYSSTTVDKKEILRTVSNTSIYEYCASEKAGTLYVVQ